MAIGDTLSFENIEALLEAEERRRSGFHDVVIAGGGIGMALAALGAMSVQMPVARPYAGRPHARDPAPARKAKKRKFKGSRAAKKGSRR